MGIFSRTKEEKKKTSPVSHAVKSAAKAEDGAAIPTHVAGAENWRVLVRPIVSEKAAAAGALRQYAFEVQLSATKPAIADAVQSVYGIRPIRVNVVRMGSRMVRYGRTSGTKGPWKKAMVTLPEGKSIKVYEGV